MKRRLTIARSLINEPDMVLLDEPTTGLDPQARHALWDRLYRLKTRGVTLILTTHYMDEAEQLCDRLVVMDRARIVAEGAPSELIAQHVTKEVLELRFDRGGLEDAADRLRGAGERIEALPDRVLVYAEDADDAHRAVLERGHRTHRRPHPPRHPRGRLPGAHGPDVGRLMTASSTATAPPRAPSRGGGPVPCTSPRSRHAATAATGAAASPRRSSTRCSTSGRWGSGSAASSTAGRVRPASAGCPTPPSSRRG